MNTKITTEEVILAVEAYPDTLKTLQDCNYNFAKAYRLLNAFATGETQNQWSRVEPIAVLAEVYGTLAPVCNALKALEEKYTPKDKA